MMKIILFWIGIVFLYWLTLKSIVKIYVFFHQKNRHRVILSREDAFNNSALPHAEQNIF